MSSEAMERFLSKDSLNEHRMYLHTLRLKHSIMEKSVPEIKGKGISEIIKLNLKKSLKNDILPGIISIKSHELYFESFSDKAVSCTEIKKYYSSSEAFLYRLFTKAREAVGGFVYICLDGGGRPYIEVRFPSDKEPLRYSPVLCVDMYEHAFFADYRFDCDRYLKNLLPYLDISRLFSYNKGNLLFFR